MEITTRQMAKMGWAAIAEWYKSQNKPVFTWKKKSDFYKSLEISTVEHIRSNPRRYEDTDNIEHEIYKEIIKVCERFNANHD